MIGSLCLHGFTGGTYEVEPLMKYLQSEADLYVDMPALPGHDPDLALRSVQFTEWIKAAEEAYQRLEEACEKVYVIGFSMGGMIASYLAAKYQPDKLVLLSASGKYLNWRLLALEFFDVLKKRVITKATPEDLNMLRDEKKGKVPLRAFWEFKKCVDYTTPYLKEVTCPVLILQGIQDSMVPHKTAYYLDNKLGSEKKKMVLYDESKHLICLGPDIDQICKQVQEFLEKE